MPVARAGCRRCAAVRRSYSRFLALFAVRETGGSQRDLAEWLGFAQPSTRRMGGGLAEEGLQQDATPAIQLRGRFIEPVGLTKSRHLPEVSEDAHTFPNSGVFV